MEESLTDLNARFAKAINEHGYPFHNAVMRNLQHLNAIGISPWVIEAVEFPVRIGGKDTRIDMILTAKGHQRYLMIGECKRVNPAYSDWLFAKLRYVSRNHKESMLVDAVAMHGDIRVSTVRLRTFDNRDAYHIALSVKTNQPGDSKSHNTNVIDETATQVLRGVNGLIECLKGKEYAAIRNNHPIFIPVVFTTAKLWVTDTDLSSADLKTGLLDQEKFEMRPVTHLYYQYHASVSTKHDLRPPPGVSIPETMAVALRQFFVRTIAVVNVDGIESFISSINPEGFDESPLDPTAA